MTLPPAMSHSRCSELLGPLARGGLAPADRAAAEEHLSGCSDCARELVAVKSMLETPARAMDDLERARLRAAIARGLRSEVPADEKAHPSRAGYGGPVILPSASSSRRIRSGAWLGAAAATLILFAGTVAYLGSGGFVAGGSDQGGAAGSAESAGERVASPEPGIADDRSASIPERAGAPLVARGRIEFTEASLAALGRTSPFRSFADVYSSDDAGRLQGRFGDALAADLGNVPARSCLAQEMKTLPAALPAYGATGALDGRRVLVLGFVIPGPDLRSGRFEVVWWDAGRLGPGATCPQPLGSARGPVQAPGTPLR